MFFAVQKQRVEDKVVQEDAQEAACAPDSIPRLNRKIASTRTCVVFNDLMDEPTIIEPSKNHAVASHGHFLEHEGCPTIWSDEPAPQWLIEEALHRGRNFVKNSPPTETIDNSDNKLDNIASTLTLENTVVDLEKKLCATRVELADALSDQLVIRKKYKEALKKVKIVASEERDELQQKLVRICTSVLEKFGPNAVVDSSVRKCHRKHQKPLQRFGMLTRKLHKKLRISTLTSMKLKDVVKSTRKDLDDKTEQYNSLVKCFENLKLELKSAEININDLRNENDSLRKEIDDTRGWRETKVGKERHEKINATQFREIQRSRELTNLKKKSEEDLSTIAQLRSKLLRSESSNSNKGFLLSNYKNQVTDLTKEKDRLAEKMKELESENSVLRGNNAQLKASVTLIKNEKTNTEKSETDPMDRMQSKYERLMLQKIDAMRAKYDKVVESMKTKLSASEYLAAQYFGAIKLFLKEIHEYYREVNAERDLSSSEASEREAHETACAILNITPGELTGFLRGHQSKSIDFWLSDVQKLTSRKIFAEDLGRLLFARAIGSG